jgi:ABC-type antimicrobial peptide transport system ATPase subunit
MLENSGKNAESGRTKFNNIFEEVDVNLRRTKILCTLGEKSSDIDTMVKMIDAGMSAACLNFAENGSD